MGDMHDSEGPPGCGGAMMGPVAHLNEPAQGSGSCDRVQSCRIAVQVTLQAACWVNGMATGMAVLPVQLSILAAHARLCRHSLSYSVPQMLW